jgi:hypothetical protein
MYVQSKAARRLLSHLSLTGIVTGYLITLVAVVAGAVAFPFSSLWLGFLFVLIGAFFVVTVPVLLVVYVSMTIAICRAILRLGRRLVLGSSQDSEWQTMTKPFEFQESMEPRGTDNGLWDPWIDGLRWAKPVVRRGNRKLREGNHRHP